MTKRRAIRHEFVEFIPETLEEGVLYISIPYATTTHLCACGCGNKVVLPLHPTHWKVTSDGETVSMSPSVGNWSFACLSHYWIDHDRIRWAAKWSREKVEAGREKDRTNRERYLATTPEAPLITPQPQGFVSRLRGMFGVKSRAHRSTRQLPKAP
jgi:hypothetical protein